MKLLLIEDESELAKSIQQYLNLNEYMCEWVASVNSALDKILDYD